VKVASAQALQLQEQPNKSFLKMQQSLSSPVMILTLARVQLQVHQEATRKY